MKIPRYLSTGITNVVAFEIPGEEQFYRQASPKVECAFPFFVVKKPTGNGLVLELKKSLDDMVPQEHLGGRFNMGRFKSGLKVGDLVPLELATTLRSGDLLTLTGTVDSIIIGPHVERYPPQASFIITDAKVARATVDSGN